MQLFADPPLPFPPLVSGIRMLQKTRRETFAAIARLERPPTPKYTLARDCFDAVLRGRPLQWAVKEAKASSAKEQARHAVELLRLGRGYLRQREGGVVHQLSPTSVSLDAKTSLPVRFDARLVLPGREVALHYHFWRKEMTEAQERLALRALQDALWEQPGCSGMELELVLAPWSTLYKGRRWRPLSNAKAHLASDDELAEFKERFSIEWSAYHEERPKRKWQHNR